MRILYTILFTAMICLPALATIINIPDDYDTIQEGINASTDGDTVLVQPGTYVENINFTGHNITLGSLFLTTGDTTYIAETIIDGDSSGSAVTFESGEGDYAVLTGFSIINGYAAWGGGILCYYSDPTITYNSISHNSSDSAGSGIMCDSSNPSIDHCTIQDNRGLSYYGGGGIGCFHHSSPTIDSNRILWNFVSGDGGGIFCYDGSSPEIANNILEGNNARLGGGAICCDANSNPSITENYIFNNYGRVTGGGIAFFYSSPGISRNEIIFNHTFIWGGGIYCGANATISNNLIKNNSASEDGGGIYCDAHATIRSNIIKSNSTYGAGGGIYCDENPSIENNVVVHNRASSGGGINCESSYATILNTIVWLNTADEGNEIFGEPSVRYCDIRGGWPGTGNIDSDPLFVETYNDIYNVCAQSPCIDAGDPDRYDPDGSRSDIGLYYPEHPECEFGAIRFVSIFGDDDSGDGSYGNPFRTIQHGLDVSFHQDTVIVLNGTYVENINFGGKNIYLASNYIFSEDTLDIQNTVIDGDSSFVVVTFNGYEDSTAVLRGFTIKNGTSDGFGGGIYCRYSSPSIMNNIIMENNCGHSGGIHCMFSNAKIIDNIIRDNYVTGWGGGIDCHESDPQIFNNVIMGNIALGLWGGGGIYCMSSNPSIKNNVIVENSAIYGGGILLRDRSNPEIINNTICYNNGFESGGGIYEFGYGGGDAILKNSILWGNSATMSGDQIQGDLFASYCDIEGGWNGPGNFDLLPMFRDTLGQDFRLMSVECGFQVDSPCIDAGHQDIMDSLLNCDWGLGALRSDIGAYGGGLINYHNGEIINIPDDFPTIQEGINWSLDRDTVLVQPGVYYENINFGGRNIYVGSLFLTTGDSTYIDSTIIDGGSLESVVIFENGENESARIIGFTIRNGVAENGGGIHCFHSEPTISGNYVIQNSATRGGGIYCVNCDPDIVGNVFKYNNANFGGGFYADSSGLLLVSNTFSQNSSYLGGGVYFRYSDPEIRYNLITDNSSSQGGGIYTIYSTALISNNTIFRNYAIQRGGGIYCYYNSNPIITNCILWSDSAQAGPEIFVESGQPSVTYCDISGGWAGEGNIDCDPMFCDSNLGNFHLAENSCCAGAGENGEDIGAFGIGCEFTGVAGEYDLLPTEFGIAQNYPNPFNARTVIRYSLPAESDVTIEIFDILGRKVETLISGHRFAGSHSVIWDARDLPSGIYLYRINAGEYSQTRRCLLLK